MRTLRGWTALVACAIASYTRTAERSQRTHLLWSALTSVTAMRLNYAALLCLAMTLTSCSSNDDASNGTDTAPAANAAADVIIRGGPILTMAGDSPEYAEAVAIDDGVIVYVGDESGLDEFRGSETAEKDLGGKPMLPGFVDPHGHIMVGGLQARSANLLAPPDGEVTDIPSLVQTLKDWAEENAEAVSEANAIVGFGYDNSQLAEVRHPTKEELDEVSSEIPVMIVHQSGHLATGNTAALALVGYDSTTEDPPGGVIQRVPGTDEPNGTVEETAFFPLIGKVVEQIGAHGLEDFSRAGAHNWMRFGYTTAQEGRSVPDSANIMRKVAGEGGFKIDVVTYPDVLVDRDYILANQSDEYVNHFRVAGAKLTIDGSPQGVAGPPILRSGRRLPGRLCRLCRRDRGTGDGRSRLGL
jgi:predicted amidohydrolase YtcJ